MENVAKPAIAVALLAVLGIGCYTWGEHSRHEASPVPVATVAPASMADPTTVSARTAATLPPNSGDPTVAAPNPPLSAPLAANGSAPAPLNTAMPVGSPTATPIGTVPLNSAPTIASTSRTTTTTVVPQSSTTYVEKKTVVEGPVHKVYVHKVAHYKHRKTDKVHVARATKHGAMFALKLPGRLAL